MQFTGDRTKTSAAEDSNPYPHYVAPGTGPHPINAWDRTPSPIPGTRDDDDEDGTDDDDNCVRPPLGPVKHSAAARVIPGMCVSYCRAHETTTIVLGLRLGQSSIQLQTGLFRACVCVCVNACTWRPSEMFSLTCAGGPRSLTHAGTNEDHE